MIEENYSDNSICVNAVRISSSHSCGSYTEAVQPLCLSQETYTTNITDLYAFYLEGKHGYLIL